MSISKYMKTACSKSWTDVNIDFKNRLLRHCCKAQPYKLPDSYTIDFFDNSNYIQQRRKDTLAGIQHLDCVECWRDINNGNGAYKDWMNKWDNFDGANPAIPQVNYIDIELDNTCDLSCLYCSHVCSSKIAQEEGRTVQDNTRAQDIELFKTWLEHTVNNTTQEININFLGGEPTASKLFYELLDFINTLDTSRLTLEVCTNGNSKPHLFSKFLAAIDNSNCNWNIAVSNESFKDDSELIRYGLDWERFENNIRAYAAHSKINHLTLSVTVSSLALPTFPDYVKWVYDTLKDYDKTFSFVGGIVNWPEELDVAILPAAYELYVDQTIQIVESQRDSNCSGTDRFLTFLQGLKQRINSDYKGNYQTIIKDFLEQKQHVKRTDKLMRLIDE